MEKSKWHERSSLVWDKILESIKELESSGESRASIARLMGVGRATVGNWIDGIRRGERVSFADMLRYAESLKIDLAELLGFQPQKSSRDVCFVAPQRLSTKSADTPIPEDYIAVPLAEGEVAAGRGMIPQDDIQSWVLVWKNHDAVRFRTNLIAVEIGKGQNSMVPTLHPQDILLVDRDDFRDHFAPPGNIFLVREPDSSVTVKRVTVKPRNGDVMITYYSDNAVEHPPMSWSLTEDYDGEISKAVIGRVVWAWSDMSRK
ncbi:MAG: S24 family peptidase [Pseudodesulfovibrio sp.]|uniref:S24 family peptidase n=1 Tax=Pseudodesulfovibrio sp. TaxID=2035812 RepID=UPI003D0A50BD